MRNNLILFLGLFIGYITFVSGQSSKSSIIITPWCPFPNDDQIFYPYPGNCSLYYVCSQGNLLVQMCPSNLWWHQRITNCDYPGDYCTEEDITVTELPTSLPTEPPTNPPTDSSTDPPTEPPTDPPTDHPTKPPTDPTTDHPTEPPTDPPTKPPTDPPTDPPTEPPTEPPTDPPTTSRPVTTTEDNVDPRCDSETEFWPHPLYCNMYVQCYHGSSYEMTCPEQLYFSDAQKKCVNSDESECCSKSSQC